jgi:hypothetical protein
VRTRKLSKKLRKIFGGKRRREVSELSTSGIHQAVLRANAAVSVVDKYQRCSILAFPFLIVPLHATNWIVHRRDKGTYGTLDQRNARAVRAMNSPDLLLG